MDLVENSTPLVNGLGQEAKELSADWGRFMRREIGAEEFRELARRIDSFLTRSETQNNIVSANLTDILLAQDFQDLTGQVIKRVTQLVTDVESNLLKLVLMASQVDRFAGIEHDRDALRSENNSQKNQANIAGYKAVLLAAHHYPRFMPMLMTAAGTVKAARVLILGAGVAGLQAIATAKRLGAVIEASDVRPAVKEQIESLGAKFVDVPYETDEERECAVGVGGYARPMPSSWMQRQALAVHERAKQADIVITTALIPGRKAPTLLSADTVAQMKPGSVVIDLAAAQGGNCPLTVADQVVVENGVIICGPTNLAGAVAADASALYARNLLDFLKLVFTKEGQFEINLEDDIVAACLMCRDGQVIRKNA